VKLFPISLGCPKNAVDLQIVLSGVCGAGDIARDMREADVVLINTCAFIDIAKQEAIDTILDVVAFKRENPHLRIIVTGCLPQRFKQQLRAEIPEVDLYICDTETRHMVERVRDFLPRKKRFGREPITLFPRHSAYVKISDGCNNRCSYCAIPLIKGDYKSRLPADIVEETRQLVLRGAREINLVAQDSTYYGCDLPGDVSLAALLEKLDKIPNVDWIRLLYTHPAHWDNRLIDTVAKLETVVKYIDLPIQHISDRILDRMGRKTKRADIEKLIGRLRYHIPGVVLRTSIIVGFPGETVDDFEELIAFIQATRFERLGVFVYSHEEGTRAYRLFDDVPYAIKLQRQQDLLDEQADISESFNRSLIGRELLILVDELDNGKGVGRTQWDAPDIDNRVLISSDVDVGQFYRVKITDADTFEMHGVVVNG
jgi:ribosomal protein S12 methylthiotransferase